MAERHDKRKMDKGVALNVKRTPVKNADQPVSAHVRTVGVAQGIAFLDFGFIEPSELARVVRAARGGQAISDKVDGKLIVRVAMGLDMLNRLQQQLQQVLVGLRGARGTKPGRVLMITRGDLS